MTEITPIRQSIPVFSVVRNSFLIFGFQILTKATGFISAVLLANELGTQRFGLYNYGFALTSLFIPLCDMGMDMVLLRDTSRREQAQTEKSFATVLGGKTLLGLIVFVLITVTAAILESAGTENFFLVLLTGAVIILRTFWTSFNAVFRAVNRVWLEAWIYTTARVGEFVVTIIAILTHESLMLLLSSLIVVNLAAVLYSFVFIRKRLFHAKVSFSVQSIVSALHESLPFALTTIFVAVYFNFDTVLVSKLVGNEAAGIYRAAYNLILPLMMVTASVTGAVFPFVSQGFRARPEEVARVIQQSSSYLLMAGMLIAVTGFVCANDIVQFLFSPEYAASGICLSILVWFLPIVFLTNLFGNVLGAMDQQPFVLRVVVINVIFSVTADFVLIPKYAQIGASLATVATETLGLFLLTGRIRKSVGNIFLPLLLPKLALASASTVVFLLLVPSLWLPFKLASAVVIFAGTLLITGAISIAALKHSMLSDEPKYLQ